MPDQSGSIDLSQLSAAEQEAVGRMVDQDTSGSPEEVPKVRTAFTVVVDLNGQIRVGPYDGPSWFAEVPPTDDAIYGACAVVIKDIAAKETAQHSLQLQMLQAQAMQEQMHAQQLASRLDIPGARRG